MKLNRMVCAAVAVLALQGFATATRASDPDEIVRRLDALEKENAALRQRLNRIEHAATTSKRAATPVASRRNPPQAAELETPSHAPLLLDTRAQSNGAPDGYKNQVAGIGAWNAAPHFEVSGSLLFLQPGAGNLEYGTLVTPFPDSDAELGQSVAHAWLQSGVQDRGSLYAQCVQRYRPGLDASEYQHEWVLCRLALPNGRAALSDRPGIGDLYKDASGNVQFAYDSVHLDGGHTFCAECAFQLRVFGGVEFARVGQNLTGTFQSPDGSALSADTTTSLFTGAGPRVGLKGQYALGDFQFLGEVAGAALIGTSQSRINFTTTSPTLAGNNQSLTSPNATQVVPSIDARLATAYTFPATNYGVFKIEVGYQAAVYFDAVNQYSLTQVPVNVPMIPPVGVFLATAQHLQSNFTDQGPYLTGSWAF